MLSSERVAFFLFVGALFLMIVMAMVPSSSKKDREAYTQKISPQKNLKNTSSQAESEQGIEEYFETKPEENLRQQPFFFPETEEEWIPLLKRHLWCVAYSAKPNLIQKSKQYLKSVPKEKVQDYIQTLLESEKVSERCLGAVGVRYIELSSFVSQICEVLPSVEEKIEETTFFYLLALGVGGKEVGTHLLSYALESKNIRNRLVALESLALVKFSEAVPMLFDRFLILPPKTPEYEAILKTIVCSIIKTQYPLIIKCFESDNPKHRKAALLMMRKVDLAYFINYYEKALLDPNRPVRQKAYISLMDLQPARSCPLLLSRSQNLELDREERILALETLGYCCAGKSPTMFDPFLKEKDPIIRFVALSNQLYLEDSRAIPALIEMLETSDTDFIVGQGSDLEEEKTWFEEQIFDLLIQMTGKNFEHSYQWKEWWLKTKNFRFPVFSFDKKRPKLYHFR